MSNNNNNINTSTMEKRRAFTKRENLRRKVYRDMTSFQMYPLQAMAMDDYDEQLKEYFNTNNTNSLVVKANDDDNDDGEEDSDGSSDSEQQQPPRRMVQHTKIDNVNSSSANENNELDILRQQFMQEFLKERSIMPLIDVKKQGRGGDNAENVNRLDSSSIIISPTNEKENASTRDDKENNTGETNLLLEESHTLDQKEQLLQTTSDEHNVQSIHQQRQQQQQQQLQFLPILWCMEPRLFACETTLKGKRRYISTHLGRFMDHYWRECDVYNRHYYELIKENSPCRLYFGELICIESSSLHTHVHIFFTWSLHLLVHLILTSLNIILFIDLEFNKHSNPNLTPTITEDLLTELFNELCYEFQRVYTISISRNCMVDLDSSTPKKFSRHWILHLPNGELFSDAREVGIFVKVFVSRLEKEEKDGILQSRGHELLANNLFVNAEDSKNDDDNDNDSKTPKLTRFIDLGVYTRNRIFRILGSTKHGKTPDAALRIAEANEFPFPSGFDNAKFYLPMMNQGVVKDEPNSKNEGDCGINEELQKIAHNEGNDCVATAENDVSYRSCTGSYAHCITDHLLTDSSHLPIFFRMIQIFKDFVNHLAGRIMQPHWLQPLSCHLMQAKCNIQSLPTPAVS